jgi:ABC-type nitrate/sulfonate/bicarbonate transport system substrate-binding protein
MVRADLRGKVTRIEDLKGRVLGIHSNSLSTRTTSHQLAELLIRSRGLKPDDVRYVAAGQSWETQSAAFISKSVDASMCDEPFGTRLAEENLAFPLFGTGNPEDARQLPGAGFLRATLFGRRDRVDAQPALAERMVKVVLRALAWIAARGPEQIADTLGMTGLDRKSFVDAYRKYPRQYSRDGRFSRAQLQDTEVFFRATTPDNPAAAALSLSSMIVDRWAASKP